MTGRIAFVGAGRWALALAGRLHEHGAKVSLWERNADSLGRLLKTRQHPDLPSRTAIPKEVLVSGDLNSVLAGAWLVVFATPSSALAEAARHCAPHIPKETEVVVTVTKGIDPKTLRRISVVLAEIVTGRPVVVLAGPGIPYDFAIGDPTSLVAASESKPAAIAVRDSLTAGNLRVYSGNDVVGVELGAALKNVIAVAAGVADGLGLGLNAKSALLARGLAEMMRLGVAMNANPLTFAGLSGMGDLVVTAFSNHSRNHVFGELIGRGVPADEARQKLHGVAEGAVTVLSARTLASRHGIEMPITEEVYRIVHEGADPKKSLSRLLHRSTKQEMPRA